MNADFNNGNTELFDMVYDAAVHKHMKPTDLSLVGDELKYDILMYLKAHLSTDKIDNLTAKKLSKVLSNVQSSDQITFNNGKQKMDDKYLEELSKIDMPFYYPAVYCNTDAKANPYGRLIKNITFKDFIEYKDTLNTKANSYISKINDQTAKANESIVNTYYLENTYAFSLKTDLANHFAQNYIVPNIYDKDLIKKIKQKVIREMLPEGTGDKGAITKSDIDDILHMLNVKEQRFLLDVINAKQPRSKLSLNDFEDTEYRTVRAGFLKMYLEYAKRVCEEYQKVLSFFCFDYKDLDTILEFKAVMYNQEYTWKVINLIDRIFQKIKFSSINDKGPTNNENLLICFAQGYDYTKIPTNNAGWKNSKDHQLKIDPTILQETVDTDPTFPEEFNCRNACLNCIDENKDYHDFSSMIESFIEQYRHEETIPNADKYAIDLAAKIKKLMDNCFNKPYEAWEDNNFLINYLDIPHPLDTKKVKDDINTFTSILNLKCVYIKKKLLSGLVSSPYFASQRNTIGIDSPKYSKDTIGNIRYMLDSVIGDIKETLISKFSSNDEYVSYIQSIYNKSLVEYINHSGLNETMLPEIINNLDDKTMNRIIRIVVENEEQRSYS